jgi:hypothetical protein
LFYQTISQQLEGIMMNSEIKKAWVEALRSGEYEQGFGALNITGKYCCLGVLCDLAAKRGMGEWGEEEDCLMKLHANIITRPVSFTYKGEIFQEELGSLLCRDIEIEHESMMRLISMNDDDRTPFPMIAHAIESGLLD